MCAYLYVYYMHAVPEKDIRSPGTGVRGALSTLLSPDLEL